MDSRNNNTQSFSKIQRALFFRSPGGNGIERARKGFIVRKKKNAVMSPAFVLVAASLERMKTQIDETKTAAAKQARSNPLTTERENIPIASINSCTTCPRSDLCEIAIK
uniref:Uncharacterized protein n=1 Tax=Solanum lycopersicum TaxID=4081 RepID=A0A3Q7GAS9_SOLLC